jgi:hypothetical protein
MDPMAPDAPTMGATDAREQQMPNIEPHRGRNRSYVAGCLVAAVVAAVGGVVLLTGGDDTSKAAPPTAPRQVASSPAPSPTVSVPPKPEDIAVAAAKAKFVEYVRVSDQVAQGGYEDLQLYDAVAIDPERTELTLEARRSAGIRTTGDSEVATLGVESVELSGDPERSYSEVRLRGCLDVQQVEAFKADGTSAVASTRLPRITFNALVQEIPAAAFQDPGRPGGWYVADVEYPEGGTAC